MLKYTNLSIDSQKWHGIELKWNMEFLTTTRYNLKMTSPCSWGNYFQTTLIFFYFVLIEYKGRDISSCLKNLNLANIYIKMMSMVRMY